MDPKIQTRRAAAVPHKLLLWKLCLVFPHISFNSLGFVSCESAPSSFVWGVLKGWNLSERKLVISHLHQLWGRCSAPASDLWLQVFLQPKERESEKRSIENMPLFIGWIRFTRGTFYDRGRGWAVASHLCAGGSGVCRPMWAQLEGDPRLPTSMCAAHVQHRWLRKYLLCEIG